MSKEIICFVNLVDREEAHVNIFLKIRFIKENGMGAWGLGHRAESKVQRVKKIVFCMRFLRYALCTMRFAIFSYHWR